MIMQIIKYKKITTKKNILRNAFYTKGRIWRNGMLKC
jgi:hypothetical protein